MEPLKMADTTKFCVLFRTKYKALDDKPADIVLKTKKNLRPNLSMNKTAIMLAGKADANDISDSMKTALGMEDVHWPSCEWDPWFTT
jgi:hypothetical protein